MLSFSEYIKVREGFGPYIGPCVDTDNYQVQGACSQLNSDKKNKSISSGEYKHKKKRTNRSLTEFASAVGSQTTPILTSTTPAQTTKKKWSASKKDILSFWKTIEANKPITASPIPYGYKGSTFSEDGIRITGSPQFITTVISHLKDFLAYENPQSKLAVSYRETESPSKISSGQNKTSFVFYIAVKSRGDKG
jgi:hypothetical protein